MDSLLAGCRVLVVEDEMMVLMVIEDMLADLGCTSVTAAATLEQALALIDAEIFSFAVLDLNLNGILSYPVADALDTRGVPFVFSTGHGKNDIRESYRNQPVLNKPFEYTALAKCIYAHVIPLIATATLSSAFQNDAES